MSSLNPRHTIDRILSEPVLLHGLAKNRAAALAQVYAVLDRVGLSRRTVERYSYELSGGQRQRVGIARAVVLQPDFVLADEIVSGLDVSTQAQVLALLKELTSEMHLALAFISHDLSVIRSICQRVVVMRDGRVVEVGACERVFAAPAAAYTRMLIDAHSAAGSRSRLAQPRRRCRGCRGRLRSRIAPLVTGRHGAITKNQSQQENVVSTSHRHVAMAVAIGAALLDKRGRRARRRHPGHARPRSHRHHRAGHQASRPISSSTCSAAKRLCRSARSPTTRAPSCTICSTSTPRP